jgi:N6-adenosine-specific RNA methylase IME4
MPIVGGGNEEISRTVPIITPPIAPVPCQAEPDNPSPVVDTPIVVIGNGEAAPAPPAVPPVHTDVAFRELVSGPFGTILIDPPWRFENRTGKMAPEHRRLRRYATLSFEEIAALPVGTLAMSQAHLYLWCPNALLAEGLRILQAWGFTYKTNLVWYKVRKDGGPDGRGVGFYFRNVTELVLFGVRGKLRTLAPGRRQVNLFTSHKREHSRKPEELYGIIEACSPGPYVELFARQRRAGWHSWGDQLDSLPESA